MGQLFLMAFFKPFGALVRLFNPKYRNLWLVSERGNDARDNGYWMYNYLKTQHPEINSHYIITSNSEDYHKVEPLGNLVEFGSFKHYLMYYCAENLVSTHIQPCAPDIIMFYHLASKGIKARGKQVFLQHGVIYSEMEWMHYPTLKVDLFVSGAYKEYQHIVETYNHPKGVVRHLGLPRFDNLVNSKSTKKEILVMPTWRGSTYPTGDDFPSTPYCKCFQSLLNSPKLIKMLEENDYKLVFYPHIEMQKDIKYFSSCSDRVVIATKATHDVQQLLLNCSALITDSSSVFFDVAYLEKPVLYYHFDREDFFKYHYKQGYFEFDTMGFGPVSVKEEDLLSQLEVLFKSNFTVSEKDKQKIDDFFRVRDNKNCERVYEAICSLSK